MEFPRVRWWLLAAVLLAAAVAGWRLTGGADDMAPRVVPGDAVALEVEVLNATRIDGLARRVTGRLRRRGIDVVFYGSADPGTVDSTTIFVRRGDSAVGAVVQNHLGIGRIVLEPSARRLLDVTIVLGPDASQIGGNP